VDRCEILISGFGGQGVVLAGRTLGLAAVYSGQQVTMLVSHGTETRGGYVRSQVVISSEVIDSPVVESADYFMAFSQAAYNRFRHLAERGLTMYDEELVSADERSGVRQLAIGARKLVREKLNSDQAANILAVGLIGKLSGAADLETLGKAVSELVRRNRETNLKALEMGWNLDFNCA
jgi:2-oxoglutarate ferredoxin oxidoreductase subunit gamma